MRFKDTRQHKKIPTPYFQVVEDEFENLTLIGEWQGITLKSGPFCAEALHGAEKRMVRAFYQIHSHQLKSRRMIEE